MAENTIDLKFIADTTQLEKAQAVADRLEKRINNLVAQEAKGRITTDQYTASVKRMATEFQRAAGGTIQARNELLAYSRATYQAAEATRAMAAASQMSQKAMHQKGVAVQQVGYQVGDFLVQVQSGTNPLVAFGQQATQLVGVIGMLNPAMIGVSAALGIIIPLATAVGAAWMRTAKEADGATFSMDKLKKKTEELRLEADRLRDSQDITMQQFNQRIASIRTEQQQYAELIRKTEEYHKSIRMSSEDSATLMAPMYDAFKKLNDSEQEAVDGLAAYIAELKRVERERAIEKLTDELGEARVEALKLAGVDIASGISEAAKEASALAVNMKIALADALSLMNLQSSEVYSGRGGDPRKVGTADYMNQLGYKSVDELIKEFNNKARRGAGSGKSEAEKLDEYLNKALAEAKLKKEQIGLSEKDARLLELRSKYIEANIPVEEQRIQKIAEAEEELRKAAEAEGRRTSMIQSFSSTIESALMSMVDGSQSVEDAFKGMLRNILLEIYRQQIVKPIATGIGDFLGSFFADGGVFQGGRVQAFATGGVVSAPTMFPMANGAGLMGEAGPEAIMPLKRGANGKLGVEMHGGGGDTINVVQNFSFSANGDESVKKIIAQAAPQIAQMTQQKIMDSRRRGGQMKATFS